MSLKSRIQAFSIKEHEISSVQSSVEVDVEKEKLIRQPALVFEILPAKEIEYKEQIYEKLLNILDLSLIAKTEAKEARKQIADITRNLIDEASFPVSVKSKQLIINEVINDILGLGPLEHLLYEPSIADILVNGAKCIYIERFGRLEKTPITFKNDEQLLKVITKIVTSVGRRIDESSPLVDARLKDGSRVNAIIPPLVIDGPSLSIRRFTKEKMGLPELVESNSLNAGMANVLENVVKARLNILISGGTGSGKTTLLNALSNNIPEYERVITIEDSAELQLKMEHLVRLETRPPNIEGKGEVTQRDLVRNALRMRPDRIVIGEVRGEEAFDMLQAMNTGHDGSLQQFMLIRLVMR
jgi:pilus assembly protein CpaF